LTALSLLFTGWVDFWGWHGVDAGCGFGRPESTLQHRAVAAAREKSLWM
jgi:hypothetical protein